MPITTIAKAISAELAQLGLSGDAAEIKPSQRPELGQFQLNAAMALAKILKKPPRAIAEDLAAKLKAFAELRDVRIDGPGFINFSLDDRHLAAAVAAQAADARQGVPAQPAPAEKIVLDYGGPNVAKAMHVGHLRSAIIGDTLRRLATFIGHTVVADVHLGDWGLPMGMVLLEIMARHPAVETMPVGDLDAKGPQFTIDELNDIYPAAAAKCRADEALMARARELTHQLQSGDERLTRLWTAITGLSIAAAKAEFDRLRVSFDLWHGEAHVHSRLETMIAALKANGGTVQDAGAWIIDVAEEGDTTTVPPLILEKSEGGVMYAGTDLATIADRVDTINPDRVLYVVDQRQHLHFEQVFRAARRIGLVKNGRPGLEHIGFGTVNGPDGKPFKTRAGGVLKLSDLIDQAKAAAYARFDELGLAGDLTDAERGEAASRLAVATIRFADLQNNRRSDYIFNLERFSAAEGRTGPYLCYSAVRAGAIIRKAAAEKGAKPGTIDRLDSDAQRALALTLLAFPTAVASAFDKRLPNLLCEHLFGLAQAFNTFYTQHHILSEPDAGRQAALLALTAAVEAQLRLGLELLGIEVPAKM